MRQKHNIPFCHDSNHQNHGGRVTQSKKDVSIICTWTSMKDSQAFTPRAVFLITARQINSVFYVLLPIDIQHRPPPLLPALPHITCLKTYGGLDSHGRLFGASKVSLISGLHATATPSWSVSPHREAGEFDGCWGPDESSNANKCGLSASHLWQLIDPTAHSRMVLGETVTHQTPRTCITAHISTQRSWETCNMSTYSTYTGNYIVIFWTCTVVLQSGRAVVLKQIRATVCLAVWWAIATDCTDTAFLYLHSCRYLSIPLNICQTKVSFDLSLNFINVCP